jgi:hypothetical protein
MNITNVDPARAVAKNIFHSTSLVLIFLLLKFKALGLAEIFLFWGFESKFYLETCRIVLLIFLHLSQNVQVIIFTFSSRCVKKKN